MDLDQYLEKMNTTTNFIWILEMFLSLGVPLTQGVVYFLF